MMRNDTSATSPQHERLANYAHNTWSGWMYYLFGKSTLNSDGTVTIPANLVVRWQRQMRTDYADLPENEKESDRLEAQRILAILAEGSHEYSGHHSHRRFESGEKTDRSH